MIVTNDINGRPIVGNPIADALKASQPGTEAEKPCRQSPSGEQEDAKPADSENQSEVPDDLEEDVDYDGQQTPAFPPGSVPIG